jgi:hypothetical protein
VLYKQCLIDQSRRVGDSASSTTSKLGNVEVFYLAVCRGDYCRDARAFSKAR